jgi:hypothetical protein
MWRYLKGVQNPAVKRKLSEETKKEKDQAYDREKRCRCFQEKWRSGRKWLRFDSEKQLMHCSVCREFAVSDIEKSSAFVVGTNNFRLEAIQYHESCHLHKKSASADVERKKPKGESQAAKIVLALNESAIKRMTILFRNVHALVKMRRPFTDFKWMLELDEKKGLDVGQTYRNDKEAQIFSEYIASHSRSKIGKYIQNAPFFSIITDGATDKSFKEQEIVYIRTSVAGFVKTWFAGKLI